MFHDLAAVRLLRDKVLQRDLLEAVRDDSLRVVRPATSRQLARSVPARRAKGWPKARERYLQLHPLCALCGGDNCLAVHHRKPFHRFPALELEPTNLLTLCQDGPGGLNCHLIVGHGGNWQDWIEDAEDAASRIKTMLEGRVRG